MLHSAKLQIMIVQRALQLELVITVNPGEKELHLQQPITTCQCPLFYFPLSKWSSLDIQGC